MIPVFILAGGLGTRLGEITRNLPKALVAVNGSPFLEYKLNQVASWGIRKVVLCVGHLANEVRSFIRDLDHTGLKIEFASDGEQNLGTGGALANAARSLDSSSRFIYVTYGDSLVFPDLAKYPDSTKPESDNWDAVVSVIDSLHVPGHKANVFKTISGFSLFRDKTTSLSAFSYIEYGFLCLRTEGLLSFAESRNVFELKEYLEACERAGKLSWVEETTPFIEIGTPESLKHAEARIEKLNLL